MTEKQYGIKVRVDAFLPVDKDSFASQRDAYSVMADISESNKLPDDFWTKATIIGVTGKMGSVEIDAPEAADMASAEPQADETESQPTADDSAVKRGRKSD